MAGNSSFQSYGQNETLISSICNIIKDYPFESVIKEFLQNADDAGATRFHVIIDERSHPTNSLYSNKMKYWQGPAILMFNNAKFKESDFKSLMQIRVGGKRGDNTKIGKHGLGFNSCYHFTDVPSFISGDSIAFLDPQENFLPLFEGEAQRGIIDTIPKNGINEYSAKDQLVPFEGIEGINFRSTFEGTLFRIPLRQQPSEISNKIFTTADVLRLINEIKSNFMSQFLFLRNIETMEVSRIRNTEVSLRINPVWKASVTGLDENVRNQRKRINDGVFQNFQIGIELIDDSNYKQDDHWIVVTGAQENPENLQLRQYAERYRLCVLGGIAALLKSSKIENMNNFTGRMYSSFQLPDVTHFPFHLNGDWAQGSDRGKLLIEKDDLPDLDHQKLDWNRYILLDFLPNLYIKFLKEVIKLYKNRQINFVCHPIAMFWPFPHASRNYPKYAIEYGCKVLQNVLQNDDIFRLINDDSSDENDRMDTLFKFLPREQVLEFRNLLRNSCIELINESDDFKSMFRLLPIWPVLSDPSQQNSSPTLKPASCGHILPKNIEYYRTQSSIIYLKVSDDTERNIFTALGVPVQDIITYISDADPPTDEYDDGWIIFLKSLLKLNDENILYHLKDKEWFPTLKKNLKKITDLYYYDNYFFRHMFIDKPNLFLHNDLSVYAKVLSTIGFKMDLNQETFVECAKKIEGLQRELDPPPDIRYRGFFMVNNLYENFDCLGLATLESIMRISFVPVSKSLDKPYDRHYERPVLDCFRNIILYTYKEVAWSQMSLISEDVIPPAHVLEIAPSLGKPNVHTVIEHLRYLYRTIRNDDEWKNNWSDLFKYNVYEVYKWLDKEFENEEFNLSRYIGSEPLFLNFNRDQDPFNADNWVSATNLVLNSIPNEAKYVNPILAKYRTMLKSAGVKEIKPPNYVINVREHDQICINRNAAFKFLLDQTFPLNDITFIVAGEDIRASKYILAARSKVFRQEFTSERFIGSSSINPATIIIDTIRPSSVRIFLRYLYGQNIDGAIQNRESLDNNHREDTNTTNQSPDLMMLYMELLQLANDYELDHLKALMELRLSRFVSRTDVGNMKDFAHNLKASQLENYCHHFILENYGLELNIENDDSGKICLDRS